MDEKAAVAALTGPPSLLVIILKRSRREPRRLASRLRGIRTKRPGGPTEFYSERVATDFFRSADMIDQLVGVALRVFFILGDFVHGLATTGSEVGTYTMDLATPHSWLVSGADRFGVRVFVHDFNDAWADGQLTNSGVFRYSRAGGKGNDR